MLTLEKEIIEGKAVDTLIKPDKTEYIKFVKAGSEEQIEIPLNKITQMQALVENPHFDKVDFK